MCDYCFWFLAKIYPSIFTGIQLRPEVCGVTAAHSGQVKSDGVEAEKHQFSNVFHGVATSLNTRT